MDHLKHEYALLHLKHDYAKHDYAILQAHNLNSLIIPKRTMSSNEKPATAAFGGAADVAGMQGRGVTVITGGGVTRMRGVEGVGVEEWLWRSGFGGAL